MEFYMYIICGVIFCASLIVPICYCEKACTPPKFEEVPVSGHPSGLSVIPVSINGYFLKSESTVLKLREKNFSWSGDDCTVKDINDTLWFKISGRAMSMQQKRIMEDTEGRAICGFRKKMLSMSGEAQITVDDQSGATLAIATIKRRGILALSGADIYLHNPPMHIDNVTTNGLPVAIHVDGNVIRKEYDFMMGNMNDNPFKIARVVRKFKLLNPQNTYFIEIGPNVDVAFMSMCTYAIDELFSENQN